MPGEWVDESILAHSCYGPLVKTQGLINGGWTGRTIYLQFRQGHRQQSNCFHGNPGDSGTPRRQNGFPETDQEPVATQQLHQCLISCLFAQYHPGCYHVGLDTGTQAHTHASHHNTAIADVSGRHSHSPLPLGRRLSEAARNGWHRQDRLSPRNMPCHPAPVSGEAARL